MTQPALSGFKPEGAKVPTGQVAIRDQDGSVNLIAEKDLPAAQAEGARPATQAEYYGAAHPVASTAQAFAAGVQRGAPTFVPFPGGLLPLPSGTSDKLTIEQQRFYGGDEAANRYRDYLNLQREASPTASGLGEFAGAVGTAAVGGPSSLGGAAAVGAYEGASLMAGNQISEDALADKPFNWEATAIAGLEGGVLGSLLAGGVHVGLGGLGKVAARYGARGEATAAEKAVTAAEGAPYRAAAEVAAEPVGASWLEKQAEKQSGKAAYRATGATAKDFGNLAKTAEEASARAVEIGTQVQEAAERRGLNFGLSSPAEREALIKSELKTTGEKIGGMHRELDAAADSAMPKMDRINVAFESVIKPRILERYPLTATEELAKAEEYLSRMAKSSEGRLNFTDLHTFQKELDRKINYTRKVPGVGDMAMSDLRGAVHDELLRAAEENAVARGEAFTDKYKGLTRAYSNLKAIEGPAENLVKKREMGAAYTAMDWAKGILGAVTAGPVGAVAAVGSKLGREYGDQVLAFGLRKAAKGRVVADTIGFVDGLLNSGAKRFVEGGSSKAPSKALTSAEVRSIREAVSSPQAITDRITKATASLQTYSPRLAAGVGTKLATAASYLRDNLPKEQPPMGMQLQAQKPVPLNSTQLRQASDMVEAVNSPEVLMDRLQQGKLSVDHVRALKSVHPATYEKMQGYIREHAMELQKKLTVQQEVALTMLFGVPVNESVLHTAAFQAIFLPQEPMKPKGVGSNIANISPAAGGTRATKWDRAEAAE